MSRQSEIHVSLQCMELACAQSDRNQQRQRVVFTMCSDALRVQSDVRRNQVMTCL
jgi:hypothetical protein